MEKTAFSKQFLLNLPRSPPEAKPLLKYNTPGMFDPITAAHSFPPLSHSSLWVRSASFKLHYPARIPQCWICLTAVPAGRLIIYIYYISNILLLTCPTVCNVPEQGERPCFLIGALGVN